GGGLGDVREGERGGRVFKVTRGGGKAIPSGGHGGGGFQHLHRRAGGDGADAGRGAAPGGADDDLADAAHGAAVDRAVGAARAGGAAAGVKRVFRHSRAAQQRDD